MHEKYHRGSLFNDIALLLLTEPVTIAENLNTICLPPPNFVFDYNTCFASGWDKDLFEAQGMSQVMKRIELPIVPRDLCQQS